MSQTPPPTVDELPADMPSIASPSTFATRADAAFAALPNFRAQLVALVLNCYNNALDCYENAVEALSSANSAASAASTATDKAALTAADVVLTHADVVLTHADAATTAGHAATATAQASNASSSAAAALAASASIGFNDVVFLTAANSPYTASQATAGKLLAIDTSSGAVIVNLPTIAGLILPFALGVKKATTDANTVTINRSGTDTIDTATSKILSAVIGTTLIPDTDTSPDSWTSVDWGSPVNAAQIINTPAGNISSGTVQEAINELDAEKAASTNGTLTNPSITNYIETAFTPTVTAGAITIDLANGTLQKVVTAQNTTITLPAASDGKSYTLLVSYGGAHTITWVGGGTIKWAGGPAPSATSTNGKYDIYSFVCHDSTNTFGSDSGRNY